MWRLVCLIGLLLAAVPGIPTAQQDPPAAGCCFQIYAAGVRLGQATSHMFWTKERNGWDQLPDGTIADHMRAAGDHVFTANADCSKFNQAWSGAETKRGQLRSMEDTFRRFPTSVVRQQLAGSLRDTYRWGVELAVQRANEQIVKFTNCEQKYFEYGWLLGYAVQTLRIVDEAQTTNVSDYRPILNDARATLNRFLAEYRNYPDWNYSFYATRSCVPIDDLRIDEAIGQALRAPDNAVAAMIQLTDQRLSALQQRLLTQCLRAIPTQGRWPDGQPDNNLGTGNWQGQWMCQGARYPTPFTLSITGPTGASTLRAAYPASSAGPAASDEFRIDALSDTQASGEYLYTVANDSRRWPGTWKIHFADGLLHLERWDRSSPWYGAATCRRADTLTERGVFDDTGPLLAPTGCNAIPGVWAWFVNGDVTFTGDGRFSQGPRSGTWTCSGRNVRLVWSHGFIDDVVLSPDGRRLSGSGYPTGQAGNRHAVEAAKR